LSLDKALRYRNQTSAMMQVSEYFTGQPNMFYSSQFRPIQLTGPEARKPDPILPDTLALRVQALRDALDLTQRQLAQRAILDLELIQDIESGIEPFLAPAVRGKLARVLRVKPYILEEVEKRPHSRPDPYPIGPDSRLKLVQHWIDHPTDSHTCPHCSAPLVLQVFERRDLHNQLLHAVKAHCSVCLFRLSQG